MKNRGVLILIVIFIGLAVAVFLQNRSIENATTPTPTPRFTRVFPDLAVLDIQAIQIRDLRTEETFTISRTNEGIWSAPYINETLIEGAGTGIAQTVAFLPFTQEIPITDDLDPRDYGFDPFGYVFIEILLLNGEAHVVAIGNPLQTVGEFYLRVDDRPVIYTGIRQPYDDLAGLLDNPPLLTP